MDIVLCLRSYAHGATMDRTSAAMALQAACEIAALRRALSFYADQTRYRGPNQQLDEPDEWSERVGLAAYRLDVTRDQGVIAKTALGIKP